MDLRRFVKKKTFAASNGVLVCEWKKTLETQRVERIIEKKTIYRALRRGAPGTLRLRPFLPHMPLSHACVERGAPGTD